MNVCHINIYIYMAYINFRYPPDPPMTPLQDRISLIDRARVRMGLRA